MKLTAINTIKRGGKFVNPGTAFEAGKEEGGELIGQGAASRYVRDDVDDPKLPLAEVLAMAEKEGVTLAALKSVAGKHLQSVPAKKDDIVAALLALPPEQTTA